MSFGQESGRIEPEPADGRASSCHETASTPSSSASVDPALQKALTALSLPGLLVGHRLIGPDDEFALTADERTSMTLRVVERQRASGAARIVARQLLARLGCAPCPLPIGPSGAPTWPDGVSGSLAHDERVAIAAVGRRSQVGSIGIDIEPAITLTADVLDLIATPRERRLLTEDPCRGGLLFTAKEAVYKAAHPLDGVFLDYHDIEVDLGSGTARISNGRIVELHFCISTHLVAVARI